MNLCSCFNCFKKLFETTIKMTTVESILAEKESKFKATDVIKDLELDIDEGNLLGTDPNPLDFKLLRSNRDQYLHNLSRDNTQLLLNRIWELPVHRKEDVILVKLPEPKTILPREKPIPKDRALTKWQKYAQLKGIQNKKKSRMMWDETHQEYRPRWGYKRANDETKDWMIEVPGNADPFEDQFEKRVKARKERTAKNELQRLRNIARNKKGKVPGVGLTPVDAPSKDHVTKALSLAKASTASMGKFTEKLAKEKPSKNMGKKRKFEPNFKSAIAEKERQLSILTGIEKKRPNLDVTRATNQQINSNQRNKKFDDKKTRRLERRANQRAEGTDKKSLGGKSGGKAGKRPGGKGKPGGRKR